MARLTEKQLHEQSYAIEGRAVLLEGNEPLLKARALEGIVAAALEGDSFRAGLRTLECPRSSKGGGPVKPGAGEIIGAAQSRAFLAPTTVVVVREVQRLPADEARKLAKWILNVPPDSLLILVAEGEGAVGKPLAGAVAKNGTVVTADLPRGKRGRDAALAWAREKAQALGKPIEPAAASFLVDDRTGPDLGRIQAELEKLALYAADAPHIARRHVEEATPRTTEDRIWDLTDAMSQGSRAKALVVLRELLDDQRQPPELVLAGIAGHIRTLWQVKALLDRGWKPGAKAVPESAAQVLLDGRYSINRVLANSWRAEKTARQARAFSWPALRAALRRLAGCDLTIKEIEGGGAGRQVALDLLVSGLCQRPAKRARN